MVPTNSKGRHFALSFGTWPEADRAAWDASNREGDLFEDGGKAATWRKASRVSAERGYGRFLSWLAIEESGALNEAPIARMTPSRIEAYVSFLQGHCAPFSVASYLGVLCMVMVALYPMEDWTWLQRMQSQLRRQATPSRQKLEEIVSAFALLQLGFDLMDGSRHLLHGPQSHEAGERALNKAARDFRDGLIIALLAQRPLRVGNLLQTQIGKHLRINRSWVTLHYTKDETKHKRALTLRWPENLESALEEYLEIVRPRLIRANMPSRKQPAADPDLGSLWIAQGGASLTAAALHKALTRHTLPRFGTAVVAQRFRNCVATTMANENPNHSRYAARLLGHTNLRTTERHYIAAENEGALQTHSGLIGGLRANQSSLVRRSRT